MTRLTNRFTYLWLAMLCCWFYTSSVLADSYTEARQKLVRIIEADVRATSHYLDKQALDPRVLFVGVDNVCPFYAYLLMKNARFY